jgi:hypothetical protein
MGGNKSSLGKKQNAIEIDIVCSADASITAN